jgi:protein-S-isoprenylcysteine O-methyltransferase Ste14
VASVSNAFLGWFQTTCLFLFLALVVGRTISLRVRERTRPITLSLSKGFLGFVELSLFVGVNLWALAVIAYSLPLDLRPFPWLFGTPLIDAAPAKIAGVILIVVAFVLFISALRALGNSWRLGIDEHRQGELVTDGVYAFTRNPIYLFFDLYFVGTFLINGALFFLLFAALAAANLHYQILQEERVLADLHGQAYQRYCASAPRYVGRGSITPDRE